AEVVSDKNRAGAEPVHHDAPDEVFRSQIGLFARERQNQDLLDALCRHQLDTLFGRREQSRRPLRRDYPGGMRVEGQHRGLPSLLLSQLPDASQNAAMPEVYAIEVADGQRARSEIWWNGFERSKDPHATETSSPSYANRICGGSRLSARSCFRS